MALTKTQKALLTMQLNSLETLYRPRLFRSILPILEGSVPEYIQFLSIERSISFADFVPANQATNNFPLATEEFSEAEYRIAKFIGGFHLLDDEVKAYRAMGVEPSTTRVKAVTTKSEQMLDDIAANGYGALGLKGFYNQTVPAALVDPTTTDEPALQELTDWDDSTELQVMVDEIESMVLRIPEVTKDNYGVDGENIRVVLPRNRLRQFAKRRGEDGNSGASALSVWKETWPDVPIIGWSKGEGLGQASKGRAVVFVASNEVLQMINPLPLTKGKVIESHQGVEQAMRFSTAGVISTVPEGIVYGDFDYEYSP